jgi:RNA polymerase sigma factor (sigma-70 family)
MKSEALTQERFDSLLNWLDPDRDIAAEKYEAIRLRLQKIFAARGCSEIEDLADETITRVASKIEQLGNYSGDPARYFYGVAHHIWQDYRRRRSSETLPLESPPVLSTDVERQLSCVEKCLEQLSPSNREAVLAYYLHEKESRLASRKVLADQLGISQNALRIRFHRIKLKLQDCVHACLERKTA